ncbi:nitronate monooxygenase [Corynebacterium sp. UMB9976]|uniref:NAD(P)H-dependent flavin oxidoreductase n=2 Tax=Corynebacterium TaxID=1716 RepID=UPI00254C47CC|nr:nitronate monooxygenase [Corynebacterium sp. UMB9976]MDK6302775.1 nitronate monooxygenase [Corynebacterium sp. UMB9976]
MSEFLSLERPIVLAPMAGGPSTPELVAAVSNAGGLGMMAAGYLSPDAFRERLAAIENLTTWPFGVNIFSPPPHTGLSTAELHSWQRYREQLDAYSAVQASFPDAPRNTDDHYEEKVQIALSSTAKVVSFTFGYPTPEVVDALHAKQKLVVLNATTPEEIEHLAGTDCDAIVLQGKEAGGHRGTVLSTPEAGCAYSLAALLAHAKKATDKPVIAAGGIATKQDVAEALEHGAVAAQVGTRFLLAVEAGTKKTHKQALQTLRGRPTVITTAFTGKPARAIRNAFTDRFQPLAPSLYPELHYLTSGLRGTADKAGDREYLNLWAGENYELTRPGPAAAIVAELTP